MLGAGPAGSAATITLGDKVLNAPVATLNADRNGFARFGVAPGYLRIAGAWRDHAMYQLLNPACA